MSIITDPLFYLLAIPAIVALGLGKGGFAGLGTRPNTVRWCLPTSATLPKNPTKYRRS
jgi:hypothetical protein